MKLTTIFILAGFLQVSAAASYGQRINFTAKNISIDSLFKVVIKQTGYSVLYKSGILRDLPNIDANIRNSSIEDVLKKYLKGKQLEYLIIDNNIVIKRTAETLSQKAVPLIISGNVVDEKNQPLPGVSIKVRGTTATATTDRTGHFNVALSNPNSILQFSFVGYITREIPVKDLGNVVTIIMKEDISSLDEVQVLSYGTTSKRLSTGNISIISAAEIAKSPVSNVMAAIQNKIPGLFIQQNTGTPSGSFDTKIRQGSSISGSAPLYIVDGVAYPAGTSLPLLSGIIGSTNISRGGSALNYLNPGDIASVEVLKDADATSIYGSRGAYGVILITTKKGTAGPARLTVNAFQGISVPGPTPQLLNTEQYLTLRKEALKNDGTTPGPTDNDLNGTWPADRTTDFKKLLLKNTAQNQNVNLTYTGGNGVTNFLIAGNLRNQGTIELGKGRQVDGGVRFDVSNTSLNKKFFIDLTGNYTLSRNNITPYDYISAISSAPNAPSPFLPGGLLDWSTGANPAAASNAMYLNTTNNLITSATVKYIILPGLTLNAQVGFNVLTGKEFRALPVSYFPPSPNAFKSTTSTINNFINRTVTMDPNIAYQKGFLKKATLDARVGITLQDIINTGTRITGTNFSSDALLASPSNAQGTVVSSYTQTPNRYSGAFGIVRLNWDNKYILSLNGRRDGSTNFGPGNRFGNFGSVAGAWIISDEPWMKPLSGVLNFAKLRASYGTNGGDQIGPYNYLNTYTVTAAPYSGSQGFYPSNLSNPNLHWEFKKSEEAGLNLQFLNSRIELDGAYYRSWTSDGLYNQTQSSVTGFPLFTTNIPGAKLYTSGFEGTLNTVNIKTKNFTWRTNFNFTLPSSKLESFPGLENANSTSLTNVNYALGKPVTGIRLFNYAGINPATGNYSFINAAGVKGDFNALTLNDVTDRTQFIDLAPKFYGGFGNSFTYKQLSVDVFFTYTKRMALTLQGVQNSIPGTFNQNASTLFLDRWQKPGDITDVPKVTAGIFGFLGQRSFDGSTGAYANATYARLSNVNINYSFSGRWVKSAGIQNLGVFLQGQNLLTISKYRDLDPESLASYAIGPLRTFVLGFNITL